MRYDDTRIKQDKFTDKRKRCTTQYPEVVKQDTDVLYTTKFDDTLFTLSYRFYGTIENWWIIARANTPFKARTKFEPGTKINIPIDIDNFLSEFTLLNLQEDIKDEDDATESTTTSTTSASY